LFVSIVVPPDIIIPMDSSGSQQRLGQQRINRGGADGRILTILLMFIHFHYHWALLSSVIYQNSLTMVPHLLTDASGYRCTCSTLDVAA